MSTTAHLQQRASASIKMKQIGRSVIGASLLVLFMTLVGLVQMYPPMGEIGNFVYEMSCLVIPMCLWGVATGIGLMRAWRWSRMSMLIFGALLTLLCAFPALGMFFMASEGFQWWQLAIVKVVGFLFFIPCALVVRWHWHFVGEDARLYFHPRDKAR